jgi:hypothetical protein
MNDNDAIPRRRGLALIGSASGPFIAILSEVAGERGFDTTASSGIISL